MSTINYTRAEWDQGAEMWSVWFEDGEYMRFTRKQGKAMGLIDGPDFSVLPPGTVVRSERNRYEDTKGADGRWRGPNSDSGEPSPQGAPYTVIHLPSDTPSDDIDFDALPIGTVLRCTWTDEAIRIKIHGGVWSHNGVDPSADLIPANWRVVYQPPALSPRQCLEALLAGRDDADELWAEAEREWSFPGAGLPVYRLMHAVGDAARGGA